MFKDRETPSELSYNSNKDRLIIPEYGRIIVDYINRAIQIEDKEQRNQAAQYIIKVMGSFNTHLRDVPEFQHKLWDQLFIMSDFKLDVDSPYPKPVPTTSKYTAQKLDYPQRKPKYRFYGNNILNMINVAKDWEDGDMKNALIMSIANHMKKCYLKWNEESVDDSVIEAHMYELSKGAIDLRKIEDSLLATNNLIRVNKKQNAKLNQNSVLQQQNNEVGYTRTRNSHSQNASSHNNNNRRANNYANNGNDNSSSSSKNYYKNNNKKQK
ncbi:DUF4290 domain-containing protein [Flavobacterium agricola]|uniref:DUF4290 domain-containing protein n=1 Tax=Flavobacterium agricola TaxID=2870839 RepID=A0ABY6LVT3_9FLAO|nr:DUF4290 domain-containing protein [Flavobacterium agricola]UYW00439.1 DUF4290 domain-containing protein [Flavobacterium agricola]